MDALWEEIEEVSRKQDDQQNDMSGLNMPSTGSGKELHSIGKRAKELTEELSKLIKKLNEMPEINYEKNKIDFLHMFTESALE